MAIPSILTTQYQPIFEMYDFSWDFKELGEAKIKKCTTKDFHKIKILKIFIPVSIYIQGLKANMYLYVVIMCVPNIIIDTFRILLQRTFQHMYMYVRINGKISRCCRHLSYACCIRTRLLWHKFKHMLRAIAWMHAGSKRLPYRGQQVQFSRAYAYAMCWQFKMWIKFKYLKMQLPHTN